MVTTAEASGHSPRTPLPPLSHAHGAAPMRRCPSLIKLQHRVWTGHPCTHTPLTQRMHLPHAAATLPENLAAGAAGTATYQPTALPAHHRKAQFLQGSPSDHGHPQVPARAPPTTQHSGPRWHLHKIRQCHHRRARSRPNFPARQRSNRPWHWRDVVATGAARAACTRDSS